MKSSKGIVIVLKVMLGIDFGWFVGSPESRRGTVIFLHGAPTQSYSYRVVMSQVVFNTYSN